MAKADVPDFRSGPNSGLSLVGIAPAKRTLDNRHEADLGAREVTKRIGYLNSLNYSPTRRRRIARKLAKWDEDGHILKSNSCST
ncbi:MAG: hypothetical protein Q8S29_20165 [Phreatobacter sp.]|nr:hypothetical protein [Phreatobacter sp.]